MNLLKALMLNILFISHSFANGVPFNSWVNSELTKLPKYIKVSFPELELNIDKIDIKNLSFENDAQIRNIYINESYSVIANELNQCLGTRQANWYHFAAWASKSAGEVISGRNLRI